ncbi:MAG: hypothetical protein WCT07_01365 [Candidatus Paceibacterota bacterium]|jgi:hypothetical protein
MKQSIFKLTFSFLFCLQGIQLAYAGAVIGATEPTQWLNNIELLGTNASGAITATEQTLSTTKQVILDPIANALISIALQQATNNVVNWANGGFQGQPLIIGNPEQYIKNAGLNALKVSLGDIPQNSIYGDSIFSAVVNSVRNNDLFIQLQSLSQTNVPSIIQKKLCDEVNLNQTALDDVKRDNGTYDQTEFASRKAELYNALCVEDPNTNPELSQTLIAINNQDPSVGGGDVWLETTGGSNNLYKKSVEAQVLGNKIKTEKEAAQKEVLAQGGGVASETKCIKTKTDTRTGETICEAEEVITPSGNVQNILSNAVGAPLSRLTNIQGEGALSSVLTGFVMKVLTDGLNRAFSRAGQSGTNVSVTLNNQPSLNQDLISDPAAKSSLVRTMQKEFTEYLKSLDSLDSTDTSYLADVASYETKLNSVKNCWDSLINNPSYNDFISFYNQRMTKINELSTFLNLEKTNITAARTLINNTSIAISNSNSSQEISNIYNDYRNQLEQSNYPTLGTDLRRVGEYRKNKSDSSNDSTLKDYQNMCTSFIQQQNNTGGN